MDRNTERQIERAKELEKFAKHYLQNADKPLSIAQYNRGNQRTEIMIGYIYSFDKSVFKVEVSCIALFDLYPHKFKELWKSFERDMRFTDDPLVMNHSYYVIGFRNDELCAIEKILWDEAHRLILLLSGVTHCELEKRDSIAVFPLPEL